MRWPSPRSEHRTDERRARALREGRERTEERWKSAQGASRLCSTVLMYLEASELELETVFRADDPLWGQYQAKALQAMAQAGQECERYLKEATTPRLLWMRLCLVKAQEVCRDRLCRPDPEPDYQEGGDGLVPVCGAMACLAKAAELPKAEQLYESQAQGWDPSRFKTGGASETSHGW